MINNEDLYNFVKENYEENNYRAIRNCFRETANIDIAEVLAEYPIDDCIILYRLVGNVVKVDVFAYFPLERQVDLISELPEAISEYILNAMEPDDRTRLLEDVPDDLRKEILGALSPEERKISRKLLSYNEDSVGRLMTPYFVTVNQKKSVRASLDYIRWHDLIPTEYLSQVYVIDDDGILVGYIELAKIVLADPPSTKIEELMDNLDVVLMPNQPESDAVEAFRRYDVNYIPVVDEQNKILGLVTSDDVFDVAEEDATEDIQQFGGHEALEDSYFETSIFQLFKKRVGWLVVLFGGTMFTGTVLRHYDATLESMIFLVFFLPLIVSSGGNSGTQAASLVLRGIAINEMDASDWYKILFRESMMGIMLGLVLGSIGVVRALSWGYGYDVALIVFTTLVMIVILGTISGSMLPLALSKTKLDPAVISSPFIATLLDVGGTLLFINIALIFMGNLKLL